MLLQASGDYMTLDTTDVTVSVGGRNGTGNFLKEMRHTVLINAGGMIQTVSANIVLNIC